MRLSPLLALPLALASPPNLLPRQQQGPQLNGSTLTSAPALSSAAAQLVAQYLPTSLIPGFAIAIQSAAQSASVTGDINSLVSSVLTATAPPDFLTAVPLPSQYSSRQADNNGGGDAANYYHVYGEQAYDEPCGDAKSTSGAGGAGATSAGAGPAPTSSSSGGLAAATEVPLAFAAAGMMGLVGVAAVL
ncbi:MAG: hypothetical protein Q9181_005215 [Wetmoreana brouardii]